MTTYKNLLVRLEKSEPGEGDFEAALVELMAETRHHVMEEEGKQLPAFRAIVGDKRMSELGGDFIAAKRKAPPQPHPSGMCAANACFGDRLLSWVSSIV